MPRPRLQSRASRALLVAVSGLLAVAGLAVLTPQAQAAAVDDIRVNEVESNGGFAANGTTPADWIELTNIGAATVDISGWILKDNVDTNKYVIPSGTTITSGGYAVFDTDLLNGAANSDAPDRFGLGGADSARLFLPDNTTLVDGYTWTTAASTTYGRCPNGTGEIATTAASTRGTANSCGSAAPTTSALRVNEIEAEDGTPGDWVELLNTNLSTLDLTGFTLRDSNDAPAYTFPAGTRLRGGAYLVVDQAQLGFTLDTPDAVRLYLPGATTPYDSYAWTTAASTTYGRCPNATGAFATTASPTKGGPNSCVGDIVAGPWPGGSAVTPIDSPTFRTAVTDNLSGLFHEPTGNPGTLWAVRNNPSVLYKLQKQADGTWGPALGEWEAGKTLRYADVAGGGVPDSEAVTFTSAGAAGGAYVATERNNGGGGSRPAILRVDPNAAGTTLTATNTYDLTLDLPTLGANLGLEGIAWVPDSYLVGAGFRDQRTNAPYNPASYANHGTGLFFVGVEQNGMVYAYALDQTSNSYKRVASFASGFPSVMELTWEPDTQKLWVLCDDTCQGRSSRFGVNSSGFFAPQPYVERPAGMPNLNNEGFAVTTNAECVDGLKPVYWADDTAEDDGIALRQGSLSCSGGTTTPPTPTATVTTTARPTAPVTVPGTPADTTRPSVKIRGVKNRGVYRGKAPKPRCQATDAGGVTRCDLDRRRFRFGNRVVVVVTVTATDAAGNTSTRSKTYVTVRG